MLGQNSLKGSQHVCHLQCWEDENSLVGGPQWTQPHYHWKAPEKQMLVTGQTRGRVSLIEMSKPSTSSSCPALTKETLLGHDHIKRNSQWKMIGCAKRQDSMFNLRRNK